MKGIILTAGAGVRLYPLTKVIPKSLLPVYDKPAIYFALDFMVHIGVRDVLIVVSPTSEFIMREALGDGAEFGLNFSYKVQEQIDGTASAVLLAKDFIEDEDTVLYFGDNILLDCDLGSLTADFSRNIIRNEASILTLEVANPNDYGVLEIDKNGKILSLEEKPKNPKSNFIVPGIYFYPKDLVSKLEKVEKSIRGEYEINDVNISYLKEGRLTALKLPRDVIWYDIGSFDTLLEAANTVKFMKE